MLEKFNSQMILNTYDILGGADTSDDFIIEDVIDGSITNSENDDFIIDDAIDGV